LAAQYFATIHNLKTLQMRFIIGYLLLNIFVATGQVANTNSILEPINNLFSAMEKGDSALAHSVFFKEAVLITIVEKEGDISIKKETVDPFLKAIGSPKQVQYHEPIWDVKINQDGNFAQVWASYAFYLGNKFNHCGIDAFQLIKTENGWKIFYLADTRKKIGCSVPEEISKQYSK
jgi:hypothetical protein